MVFVGLVRSACLVIGVGPVQSAVGARATIDRLPQTGGKGLYLKQQLKDKLIVHKLYIDKHGQDLPEIRNWKWSRDGT